MYSYSIAIRTLGTNPDILRRELNSILRQTVQPDKVVLYIAHGYERPPFTVGAEEYVWVNKGMVAQRALRYDDIDSDVILMLDDDVELASDSAERMLTAMEQYCADCVAADTFRNQDMSFRQKCVAAITNGVFPRRDDGWAFKIRRDGSFTYNNNPTNAFCLTETFSGPCWMVKKSSLESIRIQDELWMEKMGFPYGEDAVESYKFFLNGFKCGVLYDAGVLNLDAKTSSGGYHADVKKFYTRSFGQFSTWWRMIYKSRSHRMLSASSFLMKSMWQFVLHVIIGIAKMDFRIPSNYIKGLVDARAFVHSDEFNNVPDYIVDK